MPHIICRVRDVRPPNPLTHRPLAYNISISHINRSQSGSFSHNLPRLSRPASSAYYISTSHIAAARVRVFPNSAQIRTIPFERQAPPPQCRPTNTVFRSWCEKCRPSPLKDAIYRVSTRMSLGRQNLPQIPPMLMRVFFVQKLPQHPQSSSLAALWVIIFGAFFPRSL
jgi:hypothetical protein